jgi:D-beta-D-heptose 7-phosphate kinase/D-beta-D-heptose 1-phosphate adenosyltransferase
MPPDSLEERALTALEAVSRTQLIPVLDRERAAGRKIVFTNGVFDLLHVGHVRCLRDAKALGDILVVALNTDASVERVKGPKRPLLPLSERVKIIASLEPVDFVTWFDEDTPEEIIREVRPDVLVKGGDYTLDGIVGRDTVQSAGGRVLAIPLVEGVSSTDVVNRILTASGGAAPRK